MPDVFISYNREDRERAAKIADGLIAEGLEVWWDSNLRAGDSYDEVTEKNLRNSGAVVVLWSSKSVNSKWVRAEATIGERASTLVPAMIDECERPLRFELVQTADLTQWHGDRQDNKWRDFIHDIKTAIGDHQEVARGANAKPKPFDTDTAATIENTFWTSIKDGTDRLDFEAYLKRYPKGHFAVLAQNRLTHLAKVQPTPPRAAPSPIRENRAQPVAQRQQKPAPARKAAKKSSGLPVIGMLSVLGLGAAAFGAYTLLGPKPGDRTPQNPVEEAVAQVVPEAPIVQAPAEEPNVQGPAIQEPAIVQDAPIVLAEPNAPVEQDTVDVPVDQNAPIIEAKEIFVDCENCPEMKILSGGVFTMGAPPDERGYAAYEGPQRYVTIKPFAIGTREISFDEWQACLDAGSCREYAPGDAGFGKGANPVLSISYRDAESYTKWLSARTGHSYRLPTEAEWEFAARGGTQTAYWWGAKFNPNAVKLGATTPGGAFEANPFGLYDMLGNVSEWVQDCYKNSYQDAPLDGSAVTTGDCSVRVVRGGSWKNNGEDLRVANRKRISRDVRDRSLGFRVAMDIE